MLHKSTGLESRGMSSTPRLAMEGLCDLGQVTRALWASGSLQWAGLNNLQAACQL